MENIKEILNIIKQNYLHDIILVAINFAISFFMIAYNNNRINKNALINCEIKIERFKKSLINCIANNNKDLIKEEHETIFQNLQNIHILKKKKNTLYKKYNKLIDIYDNFLNGLYDNNKEKEKIITILEKM